MARRTSGPMVMVGGGSSSAPSVPEAAQEARTTSVTSVSMRREWLLPKIPVRVLGQVARHEHPRPQGVGNVVVEIGDGISQA